MILSMSIDRRCMSYIHLGSVPKLLGLEAAGEAELTEGERNHAFQLRLRTDTIARTHAGGALLPLTNHGLPTMSMTYLLGPEKASSPIVWRGLMV